MTRTPYDTDLDRSPANFQPLTPLTLLERAAAVFPDHTAILHGKLRRSYAAFLGRNAGRWCRSDSMSAYSEASTTLVMS